ncbi:predicted protein [Chaetoceros tenuissimus]|uniref:Uncharacterized protein n=1 Tax=Chaetoceros tenuissimus TaxID=426638 RepID=A0AAD3H814_9STRA|nr:predicted protein [Chaetoceros tenuissimus]
MQLKTCFTLLSLCALETLSLEMHTIRGSTQQKEAAMGSDRKKIAFHSKFNPRQNKKNRILKQRRELGSHDSDESGSGSGSDSGSGSGSGSEDSFDDSDLIYEVWLEPEGDEIDSDWEGEDVFGKASIYEEDDDEDLFGVKLFLGEIEEDCDEDDCYFEIFEGDCDNLEDLLEDSSADENPYDGDTGFETNGDGFAFNDLIHDIDNGLDLSDLECSAFVIFGPEHDDDSGSGSGSGSGSDSGSRRRRRRRRRRRLTSKSEDCDESGSEDCDDDDESVVIACGLIVPEGKGSDFCDSGSGSRSRRGSQSGSGSYK